MNILKRFFAWWKDTFNNKGVIGKIIIIVLCLMVVCCLCSIPILLIRTQSGTNTAQEVNTIVQKTVSAITVPTQPEPTIVLPTNTLAPTATTEPTPTSEPTLEPTKIPEPIVFNGSGANVIDFNLSSFDNVAFAKIENKGSSNFAVWMLDENNEQTDLLVNTIGNYSGFIPINLLYSKTGSRMQIESSGAWNVIFFPLINLKPDHTVSKSKPYSANSDDLLIIEDAPALATFSTNATGNFAVWALSESGTDLLVNDIAPYSGVVPIKADVVILVIHAEGTWTLELK